MGQVHIISTILLVVLFSQHIVDSLFSYTEALFQIVVASCSDS